MKNMEIIIGISREMNRRIIHRWNRKNSREREMETGQMGKENRCSSTECPYFRRRSRGCIYRGDLCNRSDSKSTVHADRQQQTGNNEDHTADHNIFRQHGKQCFRTESGCFFYRQNAMPSIVAITNKSVQEVQDYFSMFSRGSGTQEQEVESQGSGIIIGQNDSELLIATNNHVVEDADTFICMFVDDQAYEATVKGTDADNDLAVIAVKLSDISDDTTCLRLKLQRSVIPISCR